MTTVKFSTKINAPKEKVWSILWDNVTYRKWTAAFHEGSHAVSDWNEGSRIEFLGPNKDGMFSTIDKKVPNEVMIFKHLGEIKDGKDIPMDWAGKESYFLSEADGVTDLNVELDITEEYAEMFQGMFPKALENVKNLSEEQPAKLEAITIEAAVKASVDKVWTYWSEPAHITKWCAASDDWHTPRAENDLRTGGKFMSRMEAKDGSFGFDFGGVYDNVIPNEYIEYTLGDGRKVKINFSAEGDETKVTETFDPENQNPVEMQRAGWQAILDNFKKYTEAN